MEGAQCFIEVYGDLETGTIYNSPTIHRNNAYVFPIAQLKQDLKFTQDCLFIQTIAVWYIKPKVKSL